jgi:hypothetical protein
MQSRSITNSSRISSSHYRTQLMNKVVFSFTLCFNAECGLWEEKDEAAAMTASIRVMGK